MSKFQIRTFLPKAFSRYRIFDESTKKSHPWMEVYVGIVASISFLCAGIVQSYTSSAIYSLELDGEFNTTLSGTDIAWIASSPPLAAFFGTILSVPLLQFCGRQKTLILLTFPYMAGWFFIGFARNIAMINAGRAFTGLSIGISKAAAPIYVTESATPSVRGMLGFLPSMMNALGILMGIFIGCWLEWRNLALVMSIFPILLLLLSIWLPESPFWLLLHDKGDKAFKSLQRLRGGHGLELKVQEELDEMRASIEEMKFSVSKLKWKDFIWRKENYMAFSLMIFQQFCGVSAVFYYLAMILTETSSSARVGRIPGQLSHLVKQEKAAITIGVVHFLAFFISLPLIDRLGRRLLLIVSGSLMALSHSTLALFLYFNLAPYTDFMQFTGSWLPLTALCFFVASFSIGFGPIPYVYMTEVLLLQSRSYLCPVAILISQIASFSVLQMFPILMNMFSCHFIFLMYAVVCICSVLFVYFIVPETRGKTLSEIEAYFREPRSLLECQIEGIDKDSFEKINMPCVYIPITSPVILDKGKTYPSNLSTYLTGARTTAISCKSPATLF